MSVRTDTEAEFSHQTAQVVQAGSGLLSAFTSYDVSRDGSRFLIVKEGVPDLQNQSRIVWILNWFEELKRLVPVE